MRNNIVSQAIDAYQVEDYKLSVSVAPLALHDGRRRLCRFLRSRPDGATSPALHFSIFGPPGRPCSCPARFLCLLVG
jgi:hypothetical protein